MKREIKDIDPEKGLLRVTLADERWYVRPGQSPVTGLPVYDYLPSSTWIASHYPKSKPFWVWLANHGWDEAEALKVAAGDRGTRVHQAIECLVSGGTVNHNSVYLNQELSVEEYWSVLTFRDWFEATRPKLLGSEYTVWNLEHGYAGTVDLKLLIDNEVWIVDIKTSANIWPEHELQLSSYRHADPECQKTAVLQVGYKKNKKGIKFTEIPDKFNLFLAAKEIWKNETAGQVLSQKDYPLTLSIRTVV